MGYKEFIEKALKGRSVNSVAKAWGIPQQTLDRYTKGERLPDYETALRMAIEGGIEPGEALIMLAAEARKRRTKVEKISTDFRDLLRYAKRLWVRVPEAT